MGEVGALQEVANVGGCGQAKHFLSGPD